MIRINDTKYYVGLLSELPNFMPVGDTFFASDTKDTYVYDDQGKPILRGGNEGGEEVFINDAGNLQIGDLDTGISSQETQTSGTTTLLGRVEELKQEVLDNKYVYPTPTNVVVVSTIQELQAQENAPSGTEIQLASGVTIDVSNVVVRFDFQNKVHLTSQDKNNQGKILLGELGSHIQFFGDDSCATYFEYEGTWVHATRPIDPAPETVGIVVRGDRFKAYKLKGHGFSYATIDLKGSLDSHVEECLLYNVRATGLGYCIVLNDESTCTAYKNIYRNYRHTIAKASNWEGQGYTDYKSYVGKGGVIASYAYDSHGEPDPGNIGDINEYAGAYMNILYCYFENHNELCAVSRGIQRQESIIYGNTFARSTRAKALRQLIQGTIINPNDEINTSWDEGNIYIGESEDSDISLSDNVLAIDENGVVKINLFNQERTNITSNFAADYLFMGNFIDSDEIVTINDKTIQIFKEGVGVKDFTTTFDFKGVVKSKIFQSFKDELILYSDNEIYGLSFVGGVLVESTLISGIDIKFVLAGNFKNASEEKDLVVVSNSNSHDIYENLGTSFDVVENLGTYQNYDVGMVMDIYNNGTDDVIYYDKASNNAYRARFLAGTYRETPSLSFTIPSNNNQEEFFVKNINGIDRLFVWGDGGLLKSYKAASSGFTSLSLLDIAYLGRELKVVC